MLKISVFFAILSRLKHRSLVITGLLAAALLLVACVVYAVLPLWGAARELTFSATGPECGNGIVEPTELCDDGNRFIVDGCVGCLVERGYRCTGEPSVCTRQFSGEGCGNGIISRSEQCDDGNARAGDGCSRLCLREEGYRCEGAPSLCSNGDLPSASVSAAQAVDIAPALSASLLSQDPAPAPIAESATSASHSSASAAANPRRGRHSGPTSASVIDVPLLPSVPERAGCGDGLIVDDEACDDGNIRSGDGCSATCSEERGYRCHGWPSVCTLACGDGIITSPETCDDRNADNGDGCSSFCRLEPGFQCSGEPSGCGI